MLWLVVIGSFVPFHNTAGVVLCAALCALECRKFSVWWSVLIAILMQTK